MTAKKYFYGLVALLVLLIGMIIAGTVGGNAILQTESKKVQDLKLESATIEAQSRALIQAKADVARYSDLDVIARSVVPQDKDQAKTVLEIVKIAKENNIPIKSISFETSTLGAPVPKAPVVAPTEGNESAAPAAPKKPVDSQLKAVDGIAGVFTLPIQVDSDGEVSYQNFLKFLESLEKNRRTAHVDGINVQPNNTGTALNFNLTLNAYVRP
ncbi:MAG: hypothetical protein ACR2FM_02745 [Candidatus Saccharimonadales bacterium]